MHVLRGNVGVAAEVDSDEVESTSDRDEIEMRIVQGYSEMAVIWKTHSPLGSCSWC